MMWRLAIRAVTKYQISVGHLMSYYSTDLANQRYEETQMMYTGISLIGGMRCRTQMHSVGSRWMT